MSPELIYFFKINVALLLFYAFYRLFFYKDTFFHWRRFILLSFFTLAFIYPLFNIQEWVKSKEPIVELIMLYSSIIIEPATQYAPTTETSWHDIIITSISGIYWGTVIFFILRFLFQLLSILWIKWHSKINKIQGIKVHLLEKDAGPFSFFKMIFIYPASHTEEELKEILTHEQTHVNQWHSIDVIISEIICILCWFNPFAWLLKREVRHNLEYLADNTVIKSGYDSKSYQYHLLGLAHQSKTANIYNSFNVLHLKNRISMMNKKRSHEMERTKYLMFIPLLFILMIFSNIEAIARITKDLATHIIPASGNNNSIVVRGFVTDVSGKALPQTSIIQNETTTGTISDSEGRFELNTPSNSTLTFIHSNMEKQEISLSHNKMNNDELNIIMKPLSINTLSEEKVFTVVEKMPEFPGGDHELLRYVQRNIRYPYTAQQNGSQGRVVVSFTVTDEGDIINSEVVRSIDVDLDKEALRVINTMPKWNPGEQRGKPVPVRYTMPIAFRLQ